MVIELTQKEKRAIALKYRPLLVLYPEIEDNSQRSDHYQPGHRAGNHPPIDRDYHPRDIKIVLDNASLPRTSLPGIRARLQKISQSDLLNAMSDNTVRNIDLAPGVKPSNVDGFWQTYAAIPDKDTKYPRKAYVRIIPGSRRYSSYLIIQYWFAYFFDDWANVHEMDWEMASIVIKKTQRIEKPVACIYRAHIGGLRAAWKDVEKANDKGIRTKTGIHPIVYVANGSHAAYFHDDPVHQATASVIGPRLSRLSAIIPWISKTFGDYVPSFDEGSRHFTEVAIIPQPDSAGRWAGEWRWLNFTGRWGSKGRVTLREIFTPPAEEDGPPGLTRQGHCWNAPFIWIDDKCFTMEETSWLLSLP